jgi:hypothetical protein
MITTYASKTRYINNAIENQRGTTNTSNVEAEEKI